MISYGNIDEKSADEPNPADLHPCGEIELRNDKTAGDGLNGSIPLDDSVLKAVGAEKGDPVRVYAEANGRWILYERASYTDRAGVGMPRGHRQELDLSSENRTVKIWLGEAENLEPDTESTTDDSEGAGKQVSLTGEDAEEQEYVLIPNDSPFKFHHVSQSDDTKTECGIDFEDRDHRRFRDPGDGLDECSDCAIRSSDDMTNKELVDWLGEQAGFDANEGTPSYLSKGQLVALRDYILELQEGNAEEPGDETASANISGQASVGRP